MNGESGKVLSFGPFELSIGSRRLTNGTIIVPLGARAMDLLTILVEQANRVVSRRTLIEQVWPERGADQVSLRVQISALRRALAQFDPNRQYIVNVQGRGYRFTVPVGSSSPAVEPESSSRSSMPAPLARMVGRKDTVATIQAKLDAQRFVTIVGPGGIGKTTVAVAVAHELGPIFNSRVRFVDLGSLGAAPLAAPAVAAAFGLVIQTDDVVPALVGRLLEAPTLLVLDGCEHVIDGVSALAEKLVQRVPTLQLLATSREAMRVEGEYVYELSALACPPDNAEASAKDVLQYAAVQLLVDRVRAVRGHFQLTDTDAPLAAAICRRLDGMALAIELVAGRVDVYGLDRTARLLEDGLNLSWVGRRTAKPSHQTLDAALKWSYGLLGEAEKLVLSRLAVFSGGFTFEAAVAVAADDKIDETRVSDCIWELRSKSLIAARGQASRLRLLDVTRTFAAQQLDENNEQNLFGRRHALYFSNLFKQEASTEASGWPKALAAEIDNLRAAMKWAFSIDGDAPIGVELAAASASTWMGMALLTECRGWMAKAVSRLDAVNSGTRQEMIIQSALASSMMFTGGMTEESYATWAKAGGLAERLNDVERRLDSLLVLWAHQIRLPNYVIAIELAEHCGDVAERTGDRGAIATGNYMRGISYHHAGRLLQAETCLELSLHRDDEAARRAIIHRFGYDRKVDAMGVLANLAWLRGSPDQARRLNQMSVAEARQLDHAVPLCVALAWAGFDLHLTSPDDGETEALADELVEHACKYSVESYHGFGLCLQALCRVRRGDTEVARTMLYSGLEKLSLSRYGVFNWIFQAEFARSVADAGEVDRGLEIFDRAKIDLAQNHWYAPELRRIRGELALSNGEGEAVSWQYFLRALELSKRQESLSWALRAATSLAAVTRTPPDEDAAQEILRATLAKFHDRLDTTDLRSARRALRNRN